MPGSVLGAAESRRCNHLLVESSVRHAVCGSDLRIDNSVAAWGRSQLREQVGGGRGGRWAEVRGSSPCSTERHGGLSSILTVI